MMSRFEPPWAVGGFTKAYKAPNGRIIPRGRNGRFRRASLEDLGIPRELIATGPMTCAKCGHKWHPILKNGVCPQCGSDEKRGDDDE